jgi:hypothetical protein
MKIIGEVLVIAGEWKERWIRVRYGGRYGSIPY